MRYARVIAALHWLQQNNPLYGQVQVVHWAPAEVQAAAEQLEQAQDDVDLVHGVQLPNDPTVAPEAVRAELGLRGNAGACNAIACSSN